MLDVCTFGFTVSFDKLKVFSVQHVRYFMCIKHKICCGAVFREQSHIEPVKADVEVVALLLIQVVQHYVSCLTLTGINSAKSVQ